MQVPLHCSSRGSRGSGAHDTEATIVPDQFPRADIPLIKALNPKFCLNLVNSQIETCITSQEIHKQKVQSFILPLQNPFFLCGVEHALFKFADSIGASQVLLLQRVFTSLQAGQVSPGVVNYKVRGSPGSWGCQQGTLEPEFPGKPGQLSKKPPNIGYPVPFPNSRVPLWEGMGSCPSHAAAGEV